MITELIEANQSGILHAAELIRSGEVVGFPTETVYGLGADALNNEAVLKIFAAKGRPADNPLIVHIAELDQLHGLILGAIPYAAQQLIDAYWPGPMTLIFPKAACIPAAVSAGLDTVGIRMPSHAVARALIRASGTAIAAPSANRSGRPSPTTAHDTLEDMSGRIPMILDGGSCEIGLESTVIDVSHPTPRILRPGGITPHMVDVAVGSVQVDDTALRQLHEGELARSPGMKYRHYAPNGKLLLFNGAPERVANEIRARYDSAINDGVCTRILAVAARLPEYPGRAALSLGDGLSGAAHNLFAALRELDREGVQLALAETFDADELGLAVMNRLCRAAGFDIVNV